MYIGYPTYGNQTLLEATRHDYETAGWSAPHGTTLSNGSDLYDGCEVSIAEYTVSNKTKVYLVDTERGYKTIQVSGEDYTLFYGLNAISFDLGFNDATMQQLSTYLSLEIYNSSGTLVLGDVIEMKGQIIIDKTNNKIKFPSARVYINRPDSGIDNFSLAYTAIVWQQNF